MKISPQRHRGHKVDREWTRIDANKNDESRITENRQSWFRVHQVVWHATKRTQFSGAFDLVESNFIRVNSCPFAVSSLSVSSVSLW